MKSAHLTTYPTTASGTSIRAHEHEATTDTPRHWAIEYRGARGEIVDRGEGRVEYPWGDETRYAPTLDEAVAEIVAAIDELY